MSASRRDRIASRPRYRSARLMCGLLASALLVLAAPGCGSDPSSDGGSTSPTSTSAAETTSADDSGEIELADVATGLEVPWGIDFLPNGDALVSERDSGRLVRLDGSGEVSEIQTIDVDPTGEGGLLGIAVSPDYSSDKLVYAYFSRGGQNQIARFELGAEPETIVDGIEAAAIHNGGRLVFGPDGMLYASTGDSGNGELAQDPDSLNGKILRTTPEGGVPSDNPGNSLVYSLGHRNVEGLAWDGDGQLYASEFGESEADEVNRIEAGANYGWPEVEGKGGEPEFVDPIITWEPSEASPAGALIPGEDFSGPEQLSGRLLVGALAGERLYSLGLSGGGEVDDERELLEGELGRIRTVVQTPDGELWLATSNQDGRGDPASGDDRIVRVEAGG